MTFAFVRTRCHSHWLWQGQMSQPYFMILRRRSQGARFWQYSSLLIVVVRAPRLKYMQMHRASSPCLAILPLQPLSPFFFSTLRNHHCEQATAMMALCALTCFSISSVHCVFVTSSSSGLFSKSTVAIWSDSHNTKSKFVWGLGFYWSPGQGLQRRKDIEIWQWSSYREGGEGAPCRNQGEDLGSGFSLCPSTAPALHCTIVLTLLWSCSAHCPNRAKVNWLFHGLKAFGWKLLLRGIFQKNGNLRWHMP